MKSQKVAYVATVYSHLAVFHMPFMEKLKSQGNEVHAYASPDHCKEDMHQESIDCRDIPFSRNPLAINNFKALFMLTRWFKREKYDLIHVHTPNASVICRIAARLAGCESVIYTAHGFHFFKGAPWINWLIYFPVEWIMSLWTDVLITINHEDYNRARNFPVRKKVVYVPGVGVDVQTYRSIGGRETNELRRELGLNGSGFVVLCIAELNRNKNHEQLIYSIHEMSQQGIPVVCLLAGTGDRESALKALVSQLNLEKTILFLGFRKDIPQLMQLADTVTLLSKREGLPKVLLEAMASGKPMVVTEVRGSRELVTSQVNGYKVPLGEVAKTVLAFTELYNNTELRKEMGRNSYEQASLYDIHEIMAKLEEVYADKSKLPAAPISSQTKGEGRVQ
jgi:glycosyltransferase involved in cell wall biosynthesis